jgi:amino acid transporter
MDLLNIQIAPQVYTTFVGSALVVFVLLLLMALGRIILRLIEYTVRLRQRPPSILWRDLIFLVGLSCTFLVVTLARFADAEGLRYNLWWVLITTVPALVGVFVLTFFEYRVIETPDLDEEKPCPCSCHRKVGQ